jgi:hypothetical protein
MESEAAIRDALTHWRRRTGRFAEDRLDSIGRLDAPARARAIDLLLDLGEWAQARRAVLVWLLAWLKTVPRQPSRSEACCLPLWRSLANVCERSADGQLLEVFWKGLAQMDPPASEPGVLPLLGVPIVHGLAHLQRLLHSLDVPVHTLAIVDQSGGRHDAEAHNLRQALRELEQRGWPGVQAVRVAQPFGNAGVASAWNQILLGFPNAPLALIANHDVVFAPGVLAQALAAMDCGRPQFLALFPGERAFSAFLLSALAWDRVGVFDERYYPAYWEDLDYRDRLLASSEVEWLDGRFAHGAMLEANPQQSRTIAEDPVLAAHNARSFQLNRLWYLHRQRGPASRWLPGGLWRHRWLNQWSG